jgi:DNA-binding transcriptional LysR family regulator
MPQENLNDLLAFLAVACEGSFTKAAAKLGVTPSALSHTIKGLEDRLAIRLLSRTTRNVAPTEAGDRLARAIGPLVEGIRGEIDALGSLRDRPAGTIRISCNDYVIDTIFRPRLQDFLRRYPDITIELAIDYGFTNIIEQRFDAGVRLAESLSKDMIAVRIGPDWRFAVVGSPEYFAAHPAPQTPRDLTAHACINLRLNPASDVYAWEFSKDGQELSVRVAGQLTFNSVVPAVGAALDGHGIAYVPEELAAAHVQAGRLQSVLTEWCPNVPGYHLYYPNRRQPSAAFALLVEALRYRSAG